MEVRGPASELQAAVHGLGGQAHTSGSVAGAMHRGWMNVKSAVTGQDDTVVAASESGEDAAVKALRACADGRAAPRGDALQCG